MNVRGVIPMRRVVNLFGIVGYSLLIIGYAVVFGGVLMWLVYSGSLEVVGVTPESLRPVTVETPVSTDQPADPSLFANILMYSFSIVMFLAVLFIFVTFPYWLGRVGSYLLKRIIRLFQISVTLDSLLMAKLIACSIGLVPVLIALMYQLIELPISIFQLIVIVLSLIVFLIQHYLAKSSEVVEAKDVW